MEIKDLDRKPEEKEAFEKFATSKAGVLVLAGKNGLGKSFAAETIYNRFTRYRLPDYDHDVAIFMNQAELNLKLSDSMKNHGETNYIAKQFQNARLVVFDDIGTRDPSPSLAEFLYIVMDYRYRNKDRLATIVTTNLTSGQIREKFGDAFASRLLSGKCFRLEGTDRRFNNEF